LLKNAGVEIRTDNRTNMMHNKFWVFDSEAVWTGSTNITDNGIFNQDNNVIYFRSKKLAGIFEAEIEEMWNGEFGPTSTSQLHDQFITVKILIFWLYSLLKMEHSNRRSFPW